MEFGRILWGDVRGRKAGVSIVGVGRPRMKLSLRTAIPGGLVLIVVGYFIVTEIVVALRSDETRITLVLEDVARRANAQDAGAVLEYIDPSYRDAKGHTATEVNRAVRFLLLRAKSVTASIEPLSIAVDGDVAIVRVRAVGEVRTPGQKVTLASGGFRGDVFDLTLKRHASYFRLTSVQEASANGEVAP